MHNLKLLGHAHGGTHQQTIIASSDMQSLIFKVQNHCAGFWRPNRRSVGWLCGVNIFPSLGPWVGQNPSCPRLPWPLGHPSCWSCWEHHWCCHLAAQGTQIYRPTTAIGFNMHEPVGWYMVKMSWLILDLSLHCVDFVVENSSPGQSNRVLA